MLSLIGLLLSGIQYYMLFQLRTLDLVELDVPQLDAGIPYPSC